MFNALLEANSILGLAARSVVLLLLTAGVAFAFRRRSAAVLHGIWTVGLGACLATPVAMYLAPRWSLPVLQPTVPIASVEIEQPGDGSTVQAVWPGLAPARGEQPNAAVVAAAANTAPATPVDAPRRPTESSHTRPPSKASVSAGISPHTLATGLWGVGLVIVLWRLFRQAVAARRMLQQATDLIDPEWLQLRDEAAERLRLQDRVALKRHVGALSPLVAGLRRPVVLLPGDAENWTAERRMHVLLHELAHVQRRDVLTQLMASLTCACYWFNPLAWWGTRQMKQLREIACDDAVVRHSQGPATYAQTLLDVAKRYRCQSISGAVAMARSNQVEGRVAAILSSTRSRAAIGRRSLRALVLAALAAALLVGTCRVTSRAQNPAGADVSVATQTETESKPVTAADTESKPEILRVRVVDEAGEPLPDARLHVSIWEMPGAKRNYPNRDYATNEQGVAEVERPARLEIMRIWPAKEGYVPQFVNFAQGSHGQGRLLPEDYEFRLQKGRRLSGRIVDEEGQPIEGATVQVTVSVDEPAWGENPDAMISTWLTDSDFNCPTPVTDADGHWAIDNAPPPPERGSKDYQFRLQVTHPNFAGDTRWGELQAKQGVTTEDLRSGESELVLERGIVVAGVVRGPDGEPVTDGMVIWSDDPYTATGVNETTIDEEGRYETKRLSPGQYPLTVLVPGLSPVRQLVDVQEGLGEMNFELEPGNPIRIKIVDPEGRGISEAFVGIGEWRGTKAIYNHKHPNVPESSIPRRADDQGVYRWDGAPPDAVEYRISAEGFSSQEVVLVAKSTPHVIQLAPRRLAAGTVTDASTGEPIETFEVVPVIVFRPDFYHTRRTDAKVGQDGEYELPLTGSGDALDRYRVRFEADGYRSLVSEASFGPLDGRATLNMALQPAPPRRGQVVDSEGQPVENAVVLQASPTEVPNTRNGDPTSHSARPIKTDEHGRFEFRATSEPVRVRALHPLGYAERGFSTDEEDFGTLTLLPWATLSGRLVQAGQPVANETVSFSPLMKRDLTEARFQDSYRSRTDSDGRFVFERVPPVSGTVKAFLGPWQESPLTSSKSIPLRLEPGEQRQVILGGDGATLQGRVVATGRSNDKLSKQWSLNYLVSRERSLADEPSSLSFDPSGPLEPEWLRRTDFPVWMSSRLNYFVKLSDDGRLSIDGVEPGEYDLVIQLYEEPAGCLVETIGEKIVPITVSSQDAATGPVEIGDIEVECRIGPRVGSDMQALQFTDLTGRVRHVADFEGQYLLLHVWATWCGPCVESLPSLRATVEGYADAPLTVVGLNIDDDRAAAKSMAKAKSLRWSQNYLGPDSELMRQLAVSSAPAYYLVGPDGKLVGSANQWTSIQQLLADQFD